MTVVDFFSRRVFDDFEFRKSLLGVSGGVRGPVQEGPGGHLGVSWGVRGVSWEGLGPSWGALGATFCAVRLWIDFLIDFDRAKGPQREPFGGGKGAKIDPKTIQNRRRNSRAKKTGSESVLEAS